jgi:nucleoside-diphosphate-sugar epimerase
MKVLVIGGNRFVGRALAFRLLARGDEVTLLNRGTLEDPFGDRVKRIRVDRTSREFGRALGRCSFDAAVDFAGFTAEDTLGVVDNLRERVGHYVFVSTGQVYLVRQGCPSPASEADFEGPLMPEPLDPSDRAQWDYGMGKRAAEAVLEEAWYSRRFPGTRIRIPMVNGERDHFRRIEGYLWRLLDGAPLLVPDGGARPTRHVYSGAVVRFIADILGRPDTFGTAWNLAQNETPTLVEILEMLADHLGARAKLVSVPRTRLIEAGLDPVAVSPFSGQWMSFVDPARARSVLGFWHEPTREYLGRIVATFLAHPPADPPPGYANRSAEVILSR